MYFNKEDIKKLGTILGIWAHPDDEAWASAGIMCQAVRNGQRVVCVTATRGEAGNTADEALWPQKNLGVIRSQELDAALEIIGITEHAWLEYADGQLADVSDDEAVSLISTIIEKVRPDTIFTFGRDGITGHPDHKAVCLWTCAAVHQLKSTTQIYCAAETTERYEKTGKEADDVGNIYFAIKKPVTVSEAHLDLCFRLDSELLKTKEKALRAQASQTTWLFTGKLKEETIDTLFATEAFMKAPA